MLEIRVVIIQIIYDFRPKAKNYKYHITTESLFHLSIRFVFYRNGNVQLLFYLSIDRTMWKEANSLREL